MDLFIIDKTYSYVDEWQYVRPKLFTEAIHGVTVVITSHDQMQQTHSVHMYDLFNHSEEIVHKWDLSAHIERTICRWNGWTDYWQITHLAKKASIPYGRRYFMDKMYHACGIEFHVVVSDDESCWQYIGAPEGDYDVWAYESSIYPMSALHSSEHFTQWILSTISTKDI